MPWKKLFILNNWESHKDNEQAKREFVFVLFWKNDHHYHQQQQQVEIIRSMINCKRLFSSSRNIEKNLEIGNLAAAYFIFFCVFLFGLFVACSIFSLKKIIIFSSLHTCWFLPQRTRNKKISNLKDDDEDEGIVFSRCFSLACLLFVSWGKNEMLAMERIIIKDRHETTTKKMMMKKMKFWMMMMIN